MNEFPSGIQELLASLERPSLELFQEAQQQWNCKTKPVGSLGRIEDAVSQIYSINSSINNLGSRMQLTVFAGSHGVTEEGVSAFPSEVNAQMFANFQTGGAAINVMCKEEGIAFQAVDAGIENGTKNFLKEDAMTVERRNEALLLGWSSVEARTALLGLGEMGIGNTTASALIACLLAGEFRSDFCGRGTGVDDATLEQKKAVIQKGFELYRERDPIEWLHAVCGVEMVAIAGAILRAVQEGVAVVLDGLIVTAVASILFEVYPELRGYCIAGHCSEEPAHRFLLDKYEKQPLLDLDLRLGEGSGAALAMGVIKTGVALFQNMATFESAGVSGSNS